jgi:hypothetical protein
MYTLPVCPGRPGNVSPATIRAAAGQAAFGQPLIVNVLRGLVAETIVAEALGPEWTWCSTDYSAWDFIRSDGKRLEVKQSAARQSWAANGAKPSACSFDIAPRQGRFDESSTWIPDCRRWADVYVFSHHGETGEAADHCDPQQWTFYVVPTMLLPQQRVIALSRVRHLATGCCFDDLANTVEAAVSATT